MEQKLSNQEIEKLMELPGTVRGAGMKSYGQFILEKEGEEALKKLEKEMASLGHPIEYRQLRTMDLYPFGLEALTLISIQKLFDYGPEEYREMGRFEMKVSLLIRLFMKYFISLERVIDEFPKICRKHFSVGDFKVKEFNKEEKNLTVRVEDFYFHPLHCNVLMGVFLEALRMIMKKDVEGKEIKCIYKGDDAHEFIFHWQ
ncbi:MAG: hypothetical protein GF370_02520 [Candidatus Nealsonbacteria bacterium]|nr:hypothetical protein [Candidatus Nealsonbacteria bacterium]